MPSTDIDCRELFVCQECGQCCKGFGGTYLTEADIGIISGFIGLSEPEFISRFCTHAGSRLVLCQGEDEFCIFYRNHLCSIHPVKPRMCREWPFIEAVIRDVVNWRIMASACPGMKTDASDADILRCVSHERARNCEP